MAINRLCTDKDGLQPLTSLPSLPCRCVHQDLFSVVRGEGSRPQHTQPVLSQLSGVLGTQCTPQSTSSLL